MLAKTPNRVADYLKAIIDLAPVITEHRASFDEKRRLPDAVFDALADAGLFRLWLPEALGGPELSAIDVPQREASGVAWHANTPDADVKRVVSNAQARAPPAA